MKKKRLLSLIICGVILSTFCFVNASANSAQSQWSGVSASGTMCQDDNSPIEVRHENLIFNLPSFPNPHSFDFREYSSSVTAEYTFYNPSDYTVTARLFFPFGTWPEYFRTTEEEDVKTFYANPEIFNVTIDGEPVEKEIRHSYFTNLDSFSLDRDLGFLQDQYKKDPFFKPQMPVTHYVFQFSGISEEDLFTACISFGMHPMKDACLFFPEQDCLWYEEDGTLRLGYSLYGTEDTLNIYVIGKPLESMPDWKIQNGEGETLSGKVVHISTSTQTLEEMALQDWNELSGVSQTDWYNAMIERLILARRRGEVIGMLPVDSWSSVSMEKLLMQWFSYEITLEPGEELVNTVTAPIFPDVDLSDSNPVCQYTYLLSPAKTWSKFGNLDIRIDTPYYVTGSNIENWILDETGYSLHLDGLPDEELTFFMSPSSRMASVSDPGADFDRSFSSKPDGRHHIGSMAVLLLIAVAVVLLLIRNIVKKRH